MQRIRPRRVWTILDLREAWLFRELLTRFAARDITLRYRQTALGVTWVVLQPLIGAGVFTFVFNKVAKLTSGNIPYFVFSFAGLVTWNAFSSTLTRASSSLVSNAILVTKVYFPRILLPLAATFSALVDALVSLVMMLVLLLAYGVPLSFNMLTYPLWLLLTFFCAQGAGLIAASLMVRYRDVQYVVPVAVQFLLYASPVAYALAAVPHSAQLVFKLNPLTGLLEASRWSLLGTGHLQLGLTVYSAAISVVIFAIGALVFGQRERTFADVV